MLWENAAQFVTREPTIGDQFLACFEPSRKWRYVLVADAVRASVVL